MLTHIDLFSGIGGFALAAQWAGFKTVAFVEIEPYAQEIIKQNFGAVADTAGIRGSEATERCEQGQPVPELDCAPRLHGDIFAFDGTQYRGATLLTGGFPCQPFSQAGKRRGKEDDRFLWPEMLRVIHEARPAWVLGENVAGIVNMELDRVLSDLEGEGYACQSLVIPACAVDAKHRRDRVWIVGHYDSRIGGTSGSRETERGSTGLFEHAGESVIMADASSGYGERGTAWPSGWQREHEQAAETGRRGSRQADGVWKPEPDVGRVAHGIPHRVDRLRALGNALVPQIAEWIGRRIIDRKSVV